MKTRHHDDGTSIHDFANHFLVRCPRCDSCADVKRIETDPERHPWQARFCCPQCASVRTGTLRGWSDREPFDWVFGYSLWLQTPCCGHVLWAYNRDHVDFLESYVKADHRIGLNDQQAAELGIRNSTLASTLPAWMISAKNRASVLKSIRALRELLLT
ncbi:MAG: hypothetical protein WEB58_02900 [Planctomycetaceae bacterium]